MRRVPAAHRVPAEPLILGMTGALLLASAGLCARAAAEHMLAFGTICGSESAPHCGWCAATAALALAGLTALALALRPRPSLRRAA